MSKDKKGKEMICGLTADERDLLQQELRGLPDIMPPRAVWQRIREQAEAEGLVETGLLRRPMTWNGGLGLAAAIALVALMVPLLMTGPEQPAITQPAATTQPSNADSFNALQALMVQSRQLEADLRAMPEQPRVGKAGTIATITEIEDRIAAIDYQLNDTSIQMTEADREIFWRERVRLMKLLVGLRFAQAQRTSY